MIAEEFSSSVTSFLMTLEAHTSSSANWAYAFGALILRLQDLI